LVIREREGRPVRVRVTRVTPADEGVKSFFATPEPSAATKDLTPPMELAPLAPVPAGPANAAAATRLSYSALEDYARCGYRYHLQRVLGLPDEPPPPGVPAAPGLAGTVRGTIVHTLLERVAFADPQAPSPADVAALGAAAGERVPAGEATALAALVGGLRGSAIAARLAAAIDVRREEGFAFLVQHGPAAGLLLTGALDVLATEADGAALVVDWKSDRVGGEDLAAVVQRSYATQRAVYALAALRAGWPRVEVVHCFLERPGDTVAARFAQADAARLEGEVAGLAAPLLEGDFAPTPTPHRDLCATCPGRPALCSYDETMTLRAPPDPRSTDVRVSRAPVQERLF
jgi:ATP-dependent exoDNAse (exonuclease V) beta subunit